LPAYIYRVSRREKVKPAVSPAATIIPIAEPFTEPEPVFETGPEIYRDTLTIRDAPEYTYRDLQAQAKALDIPANQTADELKAAIEAANG
jgi:hypothetical protein